MASWWTRTKRSFRKCFKSTYNDLPDVQLHWYIQLMTYLKLFGWDNRVIRLCLVMLNAFWKLVVLVPPAIFKSRRRWIRFCFWVLKLKLDDWHIIWYWSIELFELKSGRYKDYRSISLSDHIVQLRYFQNCIFSWNFLNFLEVNGYSCRQFYSLSFDLWRWIVKVHTSRIIRDKRDNCGYYYHFYRRRVLHPFPWTSS